MNDNIRKDAAKLFFMVKGHIPEWFHMCPTTELHRIREQYMQRLWGNEEAYLHEEGFEEAWKKFEDS